MKVPQKIKIKVPCDPTTPQLLIHPKKIKSICQRDTFTLILIAALFIIAKEWIQLKYPLTVKCIKKI
jgi:hypothetical protein